VQPCGQHLYCAESLAVISTAWACVRTTCRVCGPFHDTWLRWFVQHFCTAFLLCWIPVISIAWACVLYMQSLRSISWHLVTMICTEFLYIICTVLNPCHFNCLSMCTIHAEFAVHLVTIGYGNFLRRELLRELLRRELLSTAYIAQVIQADQDAQQASLGQGVQWELDWIQLELDWLELVQFQPSSGAHLRKWCTGCYLMRSDCLCTPESIGHHGIVHCHLRSQAGSCL